MKFDESDLNKKLEIYNDRIDYLRNKLSKIEKETSESFVSLRKEISEEIDRALLNKEITENELITCKDSEIEGTKILEELKLVDLEDIEKSFKPFFKHMIVKNRQDITFIIGNENIGNLDLLNLKKSISRTYRIKFRAQYYEVNFGIFINI